MTDTDQDNETSQREACDKGGETSPGFHKGKTPPCEKSREECPDAAIDGHDDDSSSSTTGDNALHDDYEALGAEDPQYPGGVPEPRGEPLSSPCNSVHDYTSCSVLGTSSGGSYNQ